MSGLLEDRTRRRLGIQAAPPSGRGTASGRASGKAGHTDIRALLGTIENEVIPRLLLTHTIAAHCARRVSLSDVESLSGLAIDGDATTAVSVIERMQAEGLGFEAVYMDLLGGTARLLGEMWEQDRISFVDVTVGLCTLHQIMFHLGTEDEAPAEAIAGHALFSPLPGETHVFGSLIVAKFFARAGWRTWTELSTTEDTLCERLAETPFDLVGLSIYVDRDLDRLPGVIQRLRRHAGRAGTRILVGGGAIDRNPGVAEQAGADGTAPDPAGAIALAERLCRSTSR
ncbi:MAG: cobalamin-dependent protein [Pseudomonadota bacterium]